MTDLQKKNIKEIFSSTQWIIDDGQVAEVCVDEILEAGNRDGVVRIRLSGRTKAEDEVPWRNYDKEFILDDLYGSKRHALMALRHKHNKLVEDLDLEISETFKEETVAD